MPEKVFCQSCMMPLKNDEDYGYEKNGEKSIYCFHCYQDGEFTTPDITMEEMKEFCVNLMHEKFKFPKFLAKLMYFNIGSLERWKNKTDE